MIYMLYAMFIIMQAYEANLYLSGIDCYYYKEVSLQILIFQGWIYESGDISILMQGISQNL